MDEFECYKVVTQNMQSLGLRRNPNVLTYPIGDWVQEQEPIQGNCDNGGIWAATTLSAARELKSYMKKTHNKDTRIFRSSARGILYESGRRVKVEEIVLLEEVT